MSMRRHATVVFILVGVLTVGSLASPAWAGVTPTRILVLGDSITAQCGINPPAGYCGPLGTMLDNAGVPHTFINEAVGGTTCGYTSDNIHAFLTRDLPNPAANDLVLLNCGTNNVPGPQGSPSAVELGAQWRTIVDAVHGYGVRIAVSFIGYSNPVNDSTFGASLPYAEANANDEIARNLPTYQAAGWITGLADFQRMPGDTIYLDSGGIHPTPKGYQTMAAIWYRAVRANMGWPDIVPEPCGMWGHRPGGVTPPYISCIPDPKPRRSDPPPSYPPFPREAANVSGSVVPRRH
jgi:lysophospholipase L1-like esterase